MSTLERGCGLTFTVGEVVKGSQIQNWVPVSFRCDHCNIRVDLSVDLGLPGTRSNSEEVELLMNGLLQDPNSIASQNLKKARAGIVMKNCRLFQALR